MHDLVWEQELARLPSADPQAVWAPESARRCVKALLVFAAAGPLNDEAIRQQCAGYLDLRHRAEREEGGGALIPTPDASSTTVYPMSFGIQFEGGFGLVTIPSGKSGLGLLGRQTR